MMRYYPKLKIHKNSTGRNTFDGKEARSYGWHVYAIVLSNGEIVEVEKAYSSTTSKHISEFRSLIGYDKVVHCLQAPQGLQDLDSAKRSITRDIGDLEEQLQSKRIRNVQQRKDRIAALQKQLLLIETVKADYPNIREKRCMPASNQNRWGY